MDGPKISPGTFSWMSFVILGIWLKIYNRFSNICTSSKR